MKRISWLVAFRLAWIPIPLFGYGVFDSALSDKSDPIQITIVIGLWIIWSMVLQTPRATITGPSSISLARSNVDDNIPRSASIR